jgi:hypothetical protein
LCCKVFSVQDLNKPAGQWCVHVVAPAGCGNYDNRPQPCREFFCSWWRLDPELGPAWKPEVARFVLSEDRGREVMTVTVDPGMPLAKVLVSLRGQLTVVLPDRDVPIGALAPDEDIIVWRDLWGHAAPGFGARSSSSRTS